MLQLLSSQISLVIAYYAVLSVYRLYFHPLAKYPGPKLAAISPLWTIWMSTSGRMHLILKDLHDKYGDVIRTGPNELIFTTSQAYQDVYGHVSKGKQRFLKTEDYENDDPNPRVSGARDPVEHARLRKALSHAFSAQSLRTQEEVVQKYLDGFIQQILKLGELGKKGLDMSKMYNWVTFDTIGDLAFNESFGAIENGETPTWISFLLDFSFASFLTAPRRIFPILALYLPFVLPKGSDESIRKHRALTREKAKRRIALGGDTGRVDFFSHMLKSNAMTEGEMISLSSTLIIAGSETTATALAGLTWYLLHYPDVMAKLQAEVRTAFRDMGEITGDSTMALPYVHAVIEEGLRLFPPFILALPRYSPGASVDGHWVPKGVKVGVSSWLTSRDPRYFRDPEAFRPERWIDNHSDAGYYANDDKKASQPFSTGPRACLGINLAYLELRIILAKLVWAFDWELAKPVDKWQEASLVKLFWIKPELLVKFHPHSAAVA
ncbi:cytochrome P450 monooxygenase-like protein [Xylariaceae sp. FL0255]|nr:cytochrome P450 monooxygenase-like protein [Xylariaceae sp. FL0255]